VACVIATCAGCPRGDDAELPAQPAGGDQAERPEQAEPLPDSGAPRGDRKVKRETGPPKVPKVHLTDTLLATCLVRVGDVMPDGELSDPEGNPQQLSSLFGEKLTAVFFWATGDSPYSKIAATSALEDLQKDIADPYAEKGVRVIGVNVREEPDLVREQLTEAEASFPNLMDRDGSFFAQVATEKLPRVYLLDADGKVLWFDLEYSRTTHHDLLQAIQAELGEP
jgi:hypothetical protein